MASSVLHSESRLAGLEIVPLHTCSAAALETAADCYAKAQLNGPIPRSYGFTLKQLQEYGSFMVTEAAKYPWNTAAVDGHGHVQGLLLLLPQIASMDYTVLPPPVQRHWKEVFLAIEGELRMRVGEREADRALAAIFLGTAPDYQGRGLAGQLIKHLSKPAYERGYDSYWSLTANPTLMRCAGSAEKDLSLAARAVDRVFQLPSRRVANHLALPLLQAAGGLPRGWFSFFVNGKNVPGVQAVRSLVLVTKAAIPRPKPSLTARL